MALVLVSRRCEHPNAGSVHATRTVWAATEPTQVRIAQPAAGVMSAMADGDVDHCVEMISKLISLNKGCTHTSCKEAEPP